VSTACKYGTSDSWRPTANKNSSANSKRVDCWQDECWVFSHTVEQHKPFDLIQRIDSSGSDIRLNGNSCHCSVRIDSDIKLVDDLSAAKMDNNVIHSQNGHISINSVTFACCTLIFCHVIHENVVNTYVFLSSSLTNCQTNDRPILEQYLNFVFLLVAT